MIKKMIASATLILMSATANAELPATPLPGDTKLVVFTYDENNTYRLFTRPKSVTNIQFYKDERIKALALGDTIQWEVAKTGDGQHLFVKPKFENISTSATIITDKRTYQLLFVSTKEDGKWYQRATWEYPQLVLHDELAQQVEEEKRNAKEKHQADQVIASGVKIEDLNYNYSIDGNAEFRPSVVFDDGKFTYLRMSGNVQELPALFMVNPDDEIELVNYRVRGEYLVVERLVSTILLKVGRNEVKIKKSGSWFRGAVNSDTQNF